MYSASAFDWYRVYRTEKVTRGSLLSWNAMYDAHKDESSAEEQRSIRSEDTCVNHSNNVSQ